MNGQKKNIMLIFKLINDFVVNVFMSSCSVFYIFNVSLMCLKYDGLDRQWDWSHAASACTKAGKLSILYRHMIHEAQAS